MYACSPPHPGPCGAVNMLQQAAETILPAAQGNEAGLQTPAFSGKTETQFSSQPPPKIAFAMGRRKKGSKEGRREGGREERGKEGRREGGREKGSMFATVCLRV